MCLKVPLRAPARVVADDCRERQSVSRCSLKFSDVVCAAPIAHDCNSSSTMTGCHHTERHWDRVADDSELAVPQPAMWYVVQSLPHPLTEFASVHTQDVVRP